MGAGLGTDARGAAVAEAADKAEVASGCDEVRGDASGAVDLPEELEPEP
jgi:hypothetical protein